MNARGINKNVVLLMVWVAAFTTNQAARATDVSGTIVNKNWSSNNSPYRVVGDIQVAGLTIEPGVTVLFAGNYLFEVAGTLRANGSPAAPIVFMSTNGGWQGISFNRGLPGSILGYCIISGSVNSGIRILDTQPIITSCVIANNSADNGGGIYANLHVGDLVLSDCVISNNTSVFNGGGVNAVLSTNNSLRMEGCLVIGNIANPTSATGAGQVYAGGGIYVPGSSLLKDCVLRNNTCYAIAGGPVGSGQAFGGGLYSETGTAELRNCIISGNNAQARVGSFGGASVAAGGGIFVSSGSVTLANNVISSNAISASTVWGGGLFIKTGVRSSSVLNCTVAYNAGEGIYSEDQAAQVINSIVYFNASQIAGATNVTYCDVQNGFSGTGNIDANPIFLGTSDLVIVQGSPCVDRGSTNVLYNDALFSPSLGKPRNDMGAHGGPGGGARLRIEAQPQIKISFFGGVPGYNYAIQASTNLLDWHLVQAVQIAHVGDGAYFFETNSTPLPQRFYRLGLTP
jgi:hypothetical protein